MKKFLYVLFGGIIAVGLASCNGDKDVTQPKEDQVVETPNQEEPSQEAPVKEEPVSNPDEPVSTEPEIYQNETFKNVVVATSADQYIITGQAQVFEGEFQYELRDGDNVLLKDSYQTDGAPAWGNFEISFEKNIIGNSPVQFELFVYSAKDGAKTHILEIPIQP